MDTFYTFGAVSAMVRRRRFHVVLLAHGPPKYRPLLPSLHNAPRNFRPPLRPVFLSAEAILKSKELGFQLCQRFPKLGQFALGTVDF